MSESCAFHGGDCRGRLQWHHAIPRQRIKRAHTAMVAEYRRKGGDKPWGLTGAIADERNRVWLCVFHHGQVEQRKLYVTPPAAVFEFAREYGLEWSLEHDASRSGGVAA